MLAGEIMLVGLLLLVTRAAAEDVGETCGNVLALLWQISQAAACCESIFGNAGSAALVAGR